MEAGKAMALRSGGVKSTWRQTVGGGARYHVD